MGILQKHTPKKICSKFPQKLIFTRSTLGLFPYMLDIIVASKTGPNPTRDDILRACIWDSILTKNQGATHAPDKIK